LAADQYGQAEAEFERAIDLNESFLPAYESLGRLYGATREPDKVIAQYRAMVKAAPAAAAPHLLLGMAYEAQKRYDEAITEYEEALKLDPRFGPAANNLAWLYAEHNRNIDVALSLAQTAMERMPNDPSVADTLGWIYYKKGAYLKSIALLRESSEKLPENATVRFHLGMALYKNGDSRSAKRELERAIKLDPGFSEIEEAKRTLAALKVSR
jgi:tetratricopeptide (TPR) repeat protein